MKVVFLIRSLNFGGAERQLVLLAKELRRRGHDIAVALFYSGGPLEKELEEAGITICPIHKRGRWDVIPFFFRLVKIVRMERPDILHGYLSDSNNLSSFVKFFVPSIRSVWGVRGSNSERLWSDWMSGMSFEVGRWLSKSADAIIANSHVGYQFHVSKRYPAHKMVVIPNGIDITRFNMDVIKRESMRKTWGIGQDQKLVGMVGRLVPMKDHRNFIKAASLIIQDMKNVKFVCVGDGPSMYRQELQEFAQVCGVAEHIQWHHASVDVESVYNALDLLVSSSAYGEGFSNVLGEAMACGVSCVVTDVGDSAWVVGEYGKVVPPQDASALAEAIRHLLIKTVHEPARIRKHAEEELSVANLVEATELVFEGLLSDRMASGGQEISDGYKGK